MSTEQFLQALAGLRRAAADVRASADEDGSSAALAGAAARLEEAIAALDSASDALGLEVGALQAALAEEEGGRRRYQELFELAPEGYLVVDRDGVIVEINRAGANLLGCRAAPPVGTPLEAFLDDEGRASLRSLLTNAEAGEFDIEAVVRRPSGARIPTSLHITAELDDQGALRLLRCLLRDETDRTEATSLLAYQARIDALTGLLNRAEFLNQLALALGGAGEQTRAVAVMFVDLDGFKAVNDRMGHEAGDELLVAAARRIARSVRDVDVVGRLGGDEFGILSAKVSDESEARAIADRLVAALARPFVLDAGRVVVTASVGVALCPPVDAVAEVLLAEADRAMYAAKAQGKNRYQVAGDSLAQHTAARAATESALRGALTRGELRLVHQPQIDLRTGGIVAVEALVRWDRGGGVMTAGDFITVAEETGVIVPIGRWVLEEACRAAGRWPGPPVSVCVNVSAAQLREPGFVDDVVATLERTGLDAGRLRLEIPEKVAAEAGDVGVWLQRLHELGVRLTVDDVGTTQASLRYLRKLPVDAVKIDRSFVAGLGLQPRDSLVVSSVIELTDALGVQAVAAGVETLAQLLLLRSAGCAYAQGYLLSEPQDADEVGKLLACGWRQQLVLG